MAMRSLVTKNGRKPAIGIVLILVVGVSIIIGCGQESIKSVAENDKAANTKLTSVTTSTLGNLTPSKSIEVTISASDSSDAIDSIAVSFRNQRLETTPASTAMVLLNTLPVGKQTLTVQVFLSNRRVETHSINIILYSEAPPVSYTYSKLQTFTHDPDAYTQGLIFHDGFFYESTGTKGESTLRKVDISNGKVVRQLDLSDEYFGEGLVVHRNRLIQLTWTSHIGFIYNLDNFEQIGTFNYPTEGWGLAVLGDELVMSDGSENLYFLDADTFVEKRRVQVYNHERAITNLNELEIVEGKIYANVYQTDTILIIDPGSGRVEGEINLEGIFNSSGYSRRLDVLNGIAWDAESKRLFVTGKWWPKLYQIEVKEVPI